MYTIVSTGHPAVVVDRTGTGALKGISWTGNGVVVGCRINWSGAGAVMDCIISAGQKWAAYHISRTGTRTKVGLVLSSSAL